MPDMTHETFYHCTSAERYQTMIQGTSQLYQVTYNAGNPGPYEYNWRCECIGFRARGNCKHIEKAKAGQCGWMQFTDGGEVIEYEGRVYCPNCQNRAESRRWAV